MDTDFFLERKLKDEAPELHQCVRDSVFMLQGMLESFLPRFPDFTDRSLLHSMDVLDYANRILGQEQMCRLSAGECFVLIMACYLHDIGMGISQKDYEVFSRSIDFGDYFETHDKADTARTIRDFHNEYSGLFIRKYAELLEIPAGNILFAVIQTSRGHRKTDLLDSAEYPELHTPYGVITRKLFQKTMITMVIAELTGGVTAIIDGILVGRYLDANIVIIDIEVVFTALAAYLLSSFLGAAGVWIAYAAGQAMLSLFLVLRMLLSRDSGRTGLESNMLLPKDFGIPAHDCIERSLHSVDEVVALSGEVVPFCAERGIAVQTANRLALCIEEMAGNVIEHGFADGKPHHLDVRVLVKDGTMVLRLRDDCSKFDLREKAASWQPDPEHPERNIGIHIIMRVAKDVAYTNTMNTNNLIITI